MNLLCCGIKLLLLFLGRLQDAHLHSLGARPVAKVVQALALQVRDRRKRQRTVVRLEPPGGTGPQAIVHKVEQTRGSWFPVFPDSHSTVRANDSRERGSLIAHSDAPSATSPTSVTPPVR